MKTTLVLLLTAALAEPLDAEVELLAPDFTLFEKTSGDYLAEYLQYTLTLSTNGDYFLPQAGPQGNPVYFLQRPLFSLASPGIQTYFIPDDVYVYFPIVFFWGDNIDTSPPSSADELRDGLNSIIDVITDVHATIDGVPASNLMAYRTESPTFALLLPSSDNYYSLLLRYPLVGLIDPVIVAGYAIMLQPLSPGLHDFQVGATIGGPNNFSFKRHFQVYSLSLQERLARDTEQLASAVRNSPLTTASQRPLLASLSTISAAFEAGRWEPASRALRAFLHKVKAQVAPNNSTLALELSTSAQNILEKAAIR